jgi:hypothetical protein
MYVSYGLGSSFVDANTFSEDGVTDIIRRLTHANLIANYRMTYILLLADF